MCIRTARQARFGENFMNHGTCSKRLAQLSENKLTMKNKSESFSTRISESFFHKEKLIIEHLSILVGMAAFAISLRADCTLRSTGNAPLNELTVPYRGTQGGLYPNGANNRPAAHLKANPRNCLEFR